MTRPRICPTCSLRPVATPRHRHCYQCLPGGPFTAPPCRKCGSTTLYYSSGLCQRCHPFAPQVVDSCVDCLGWGTSRRTGWLCEACRGLRRRFPNPATCRSCRRTIAVSADGFCRLCWRQSVGSRPHGKGPRVLEANRHGQQLFIVELFRQKRRTPAPPHQPELPGSGIYPVTHQQLLLLDVPRDLARGYRYGFGDQPDPAFARLLDQAAREHGRRHGWSKTRLADARKGVRILLALQDTPGAAINASDVARLDQIAVAVQPILDILDSAGMLNDDREPRLVSWFARQVDGLPEQLIGELRVWFDVLRSGGTTPPRSRPRAEGTVRMRVRHAMPAVRAWAEAGHTSLREITRDHIKDALPDRGNDRFLVGQALRSLFRVLKAKRLVFVNPTTQIRTGRPQTCTPLPLDIIQLRDAVNSADPARALIAALIGFHALRSGQLRALLLTDIRDGRLHLPDRTILLALPARDRLTAWLDHRNRRWPATANPLLLINTKTAVRVGQVSHLWINQTLGLSAQAVREDRILHEAMVTGGDVRRLCDLFGLSVKGAERYAHVLDPPTALDTSTRTSTKTSGVRATAGAGEPGPSSKGQ